MTATTDARLVGLPKNITGIFFSFKNNQISKIYIIGLFAADTLQEVKPTRNQSNTIPTLSPQFRNNGSANLLLASSEQNHHKLQQLRSSKVETQQYYSTNGNNGATIDSSNDSRLTKDRLRNGFRPSTLRRQKVPVTTATALRDSAYRDSKDFSPRQSFNPSPASVRLKSEINQINSRLKIHGDLGKNSRLQHNQV